MFATPEYRDLLMAQSRLMQEITSPVTDASLIPQLCNSLCKVLDTKRIIRMKPKPKDVDTLKLAKSSGKTIDISPEDEPIAPVTIGQGVV